MPSNAIESNEIELARIRHAFWLAIIGLLLAAALAIFFVIYGEPKLHTSAEVVGIVGLFTSVTGTLVGAFFGLQVGSAGVEHERSNRRKAEEISRTALAHLHPDAAKEVVASFKSQ